MVQALKFDDKILLNIPVNLIRPNPYQPRRVFDKEALCELADSIKQFGVMQPVNVRKSGDRYELISGERRLRAARLAGLETIPAIVNQVCERDSAFCALMENLQRENLNYIEEAEGYNNLIKDYQMTQEEVAARLGKSQSGVANKVRLLKLPDLVKDALRTNGLTERHARALLKLPCEEEQIIAVERIVREKLNVQKTDEYIERILNKKNKENTKKGRFYIKDQRIYINTIKKAVELIGRSGGEASYKVEDGDEEVLVIVRIAKRVVSEP